jgi:hypothetical protein
LRASSPPMTKKSPPLFEDDASNLQGRSHLDGLSSIVITSRRS